MNNSEKNWAIPMEVDEQAISDLGLSRKDIQKVKIGCRLTDGIMVPCTEQQYKDYMHEEWAEEQRIFRSRKCMVPSEKTGKLIRCTRSCKDCPEMKNGTPLSLNAFKDENDIEPEGLENETTDEESTVLTMVLIRQLIEKLRKQSPELAEIFQMLLDGDSHKDIAAAIGKPRQTTTDLIARLRKQLQEEVSRSDIFS